MYFEYKLKSRLNADTKFIEHQVLYYSLVFHAAPRVSCWKGTSYDGNTESVFGLFFFTMRWGKKKILEPARKLSHYILGDED